MPLDYFALKKIVKYKLKKRSNILICIPTYNSFQITDTLITLLKNQEGILFDLLIIDNGTKDHIALREKYPNINFILLNANYGSSGAQHIGILFSLEYKYDFVMLTDNDALLLNNCGIKIMHDKLKNNLDLNACIPLHTESFDSSITSDFFIENWAFHYLLIKTSIFKKIKPPRFNLFLYGDDTSLTTKIGKILVCTDVKYYHYKISPKHFYNHYTYFYMRGLLLIIFKEDPITLRSKLIYTSQFIYKIIQLIVNTFYLKDLSLLHTLYLAICGFIFEEKDFSKNIKKNNFEYVEVFTIIPGATSAVPLFNRFIFKSGYFIDDIYKNERRYYLRYKI